VELTKRAEELRAQFLTHPPQPLKLEKILAVWVGTEKL
jgi:hypothetical protein